MSQTKRGKSKKLKYPPIIVERDRKMKHRLNVTFPSRELADAVKEFVRKLRSKTKI
jgi:hypothetical protein